MLNRIKSAWYGLTRGANLSLSDWQAMLDAQADGFGDETLSGVNVSVASGARHPTVYACINILSRDMAALPIKLYERQPNGGRREVGPDEHAVAAWLRRPNPVMTAMQYRQRGWVSVLTHGNDYGQVVREPNGEIVTWPLRASATTVEVEKNGIKRYEFTPEGEAEPKKLSADKVLHNFGLSFDGYRGVSPIRQCMETIGRAIAVGEYGASWFQSPMPKVVFETESSVKDPARDEFLKQWGEKFAGKRGIRRGAMLPPGVKLTHVLKIPNDEAQWIETQKFSKEEIAQLFLVPMHRLQALDRATFSNIEEQSLSYVVYTLLPWLTAFEQSIERQFLTLAEEGRLFVRHTVDALLRGDVKTRMEGHSTAIQVGLATINERRALENLPAMDGGDELLVPLNLVRLSDLEAPADEGDSPAPGDSPTDDGDDDDGDDERSKALNLRNGIELTAINGAAARRRLAKRYRPKFRAVLKRVATEEAKAIRSELRSAVQRNAQSFAEWLTTYYEGRQKGVARSVQGVLGSLGADTVELAQAERKGDFDDLDAFSASYAATFAANWSSSARSQLSNIAEEAEAAGEIVSVAVGERVAEWESGGNRANKSAGRETFTFANAVAGALFSRGGRRLRWITFGKNCPFCNSLSGKRVAAGASFVPLGDFQPEGAPSALKIRGIKKHPPIHRGCDCMVGPG